MTPTQVALVQHSFRKISPYGDTVAALFYENLFTLDPALRGQFGADRRLEGRRLLAMLAMGVAGLDRLDQLAPTMTALGSRRSGLGMQLGSHNIVVSAWLQTLRQCLGSAFAPAVREAWIAAHAILVDAMTCAGSQVPIKAAA